MKMGRFYGYSKQRIIAKTKPKVIASPMPTFRVVMVVGPKRRQIIKDLNFCKTKTLKRCIALFMFN